MNRRAFIVAVQVAQGASRLAHKRHEDERALNWLNATIQQALLELLFSTKRIPTDEQWYSGGPMGQAFAVWIGERNEADRKARKAPPVNLIYVHAGKVK